MAPREDDEPSESWEAKVAVFHTAQRSNPKAGLPELDECSARHTAVESAASHDPEPSPFAALAGRAAAGAGRRPLQMRRHALEQGRRQRHVPLRTCIRSGPYDDFWCQRCAGRRQLTAERTAH